MNIQQKRISLKMVMFFFLCCHNFSNARAKRPSRKHKKLEASQMENKLQVDKSKTKEETYDNAIGEEN
jgi:hypothetical protein